MTLRLSRRKEEGVGRKDGMRIEDYPYYAKFLRKLGTALIIAGIALPISTAREVR